MMKAALLLAAFFILHAPARAQTACPSSLDGEKARATLESLFYAEEFAEARTLRGNTAVLDSSAIRPLTDSQDSDVCRVLATQVQTDPYLRVAPWKSVFYEAGGWYFVVSLKYPLEQYEVRVVNNHLSGSYYFAPVDAYDANLNRIARWGL